jgi:Fe-S cluster biogenesis protein NfuA
MKKSIRERVEEVFVMVRPYLRMDGGDIEYVNYEPDTGTLEVRLTGNCKDCPMAMMTLRAGVERLILKEIEEVKRLEKVR